jgi:hypothetical protein
MLVSDIIWDTEGQDVNLPKDVEVEEGLSNEEIETYLSDTYGYCVCAYSVPMTDDDVDYFGLYVNEVEGRVS